MSEKERPFQSAILEVLQEPTFLLSLKGEFLKSNRSGIDLLGYAWEELQSKTLWDLISPDHSSRMRDGFELMGQGKTLQGRTVVLHRSGSPIPVELSGLRSEGISFVTLKDLRERIRLEEDWERTKKEFLEKIRERDQSTRELQTLRDLYKEKLKEIERLTDEAVVLSYTDDLTGVYNHRFFIKQLTMEMERRKRYPSPLSLLMIDIDYFKHYNDANGHLAGDQVLQNIALLIRYGVRESDIVARYGGEEFSAILINAGKEGALEIAERVRRMVANARFPNEASQPNGALSVSIGVATFSPSISTLADLIREADNALYRAKKAGRNCVEG